jgi:hypothetical protein
MIDSVIKKVTVEKFDDEGNLTERVITEYGPLTPYVAPNPSLPGIRVGDVWPYSSVTSQIVTTDPNKYTVWNGVE